MEQIPLSKRFAKRIIIKANAIVHLPYASTPYLPYINLINFSFKIITFLINNILRERDGKSINLVLKIYKIQTRRVIIICKALEGGSLYGAYEFD